MQRRTNIYIKNKVLMNRIHECRIVDILTDAQYVDMYERMRNKQIEAYNKYMENKDDIECRNKNKN